MEVNSDKQEIKNTIKFAIAVNFIVYICVTCFIWSISTGYDSAPDEDLKYKLCNYLCEHSKLPHGGDEKIMDEEWGTSYAFTPYLSYMISSVFMRIVKIFTNDFYSLVVSARFFNVICITLYSFMCIKISIKLFKGIYKYLFILLATQIPQVLYLGSYINNDSFALFIISLIIYCWICGVENDWNYKYCIFLGISLGLCALSYYNAYGYILCSIIIFIGSCLNKKNKIQNILKKGILIFFIAFLISGWFFIRNFIIYNGDFLGLSTSFKYAEKYASYEHKPQNLKKLNSKDNWNLWKKITYKSFIGYFGYLCFLMPNSIYNYFKILFFLGICGSILKLILIKQNKTIESKNEKLFKLVFLISIIIPFVLSLYYSITCDFQAQGRYLMPGIIPFIYYIVDGISTLMDKYIKNKIVKNIIVIIVLGALIVIPIYAYFSIIRYMKV
ncbi:MAG: DUF2142 domain-containing protein [Clostridia bacterium]|nr:DUF2142 domain-containing protein [Clostridia bacterium]